MQDARRALRILESFALLALILLLAAAPAVAGREVCAGGACAKYEEDAYGDGDCESGNAGAFRSYSASYDDGASATGVYVSEFCWSETGEYSGSSRATSVGVTRLEWESFTMQGVVLIWESGSYGEDSWCGATLHVHAPGLGTLVPAPCPGGQPPPRVLPALP